MGKIFKLFFPCGSFSKLKDLRHTYNVASHFLKKEELSDFKK